MRTEYAFTLPRGYVDAAGTVHREGTMRLATARDEIEPLRDPRCARTRRTSPCSCSPAWSPGSATSTEVTPELVEELFAADFDHLQRLYERLNTDGEAVGAVTCPHCSHAFEVDLTEIEDGRLGE